MAAGCARAARFLIKASIMQAAGAMVEPSNIGRGLTNMREQQGESEWSTVAAASAADKVLHSVPAESPGVGGEWQSLTLCPVRDAFLRPVVWADFDTSIVEVARLLRQHRSSCVLVRDERQPVRRTGIFTATGLQRAVLDGRPLSALAVGELANFDLVTADPQMLLGDAMALMLRSRVHRLVVCTEGAETGVLEALDLFSFLSNHSHLITVQIEAATDLADLSEAAGRITRMMASLQSSGTRVELIARLVQQLNARLFQRAWELVAPEELVRRSCLVVMGSEGRGEQLLKTDQDNGLILEDGYVPPVDLADICERFSAALGDFGYPPCPGRIMVNNAQWRMSSAEFSRAVRQWLIAPEADSLMKLAIFMDAHAVCGNPALLSRVQEGLCELAVGNDLMMARFAAAADAFGREPGWWSRLLGRSDRSASLHLKKEGIFPLVHGVRSLALAHRLAGCAGTAERVKALVKGENLPVDLGRDLIDSLHFFLGLKLRAGLAELAAGVPVSGEVDVDHLPGLERDGLKDALAVVKRFRTLLRQRFHLDAL
ncbi:MAG: CBS domain-containing protein [Burkholderiaceae bacterium]|nr:CBS domain-containing protein [Burkholderiaceae bacterium]